MKSINKMSDQELNLMRLAIDNELTKRKGKPIEVILIICGTSEYYFRMSETAKIKHVMDLVIDYQLSIAAKGGSPSGIMLRETTLEEQELGVELANTEIALLNDWGDSYKKV